ncbi:MAG: hypothetical protein HQL02_10230, partial [Nitrospirae bacterium]|nr:hypothetical protein [Nitrospirota bacterium]
MGDANHHPLLHIYNHHAVMFTRLLTLFELELAAMELFKDLIALSRFWVAAELKAAVEAAVEAAEVLDVPVEE